MPRVRSSPKPAGRDCIEIDPAPSGVRQLIAEPVAYQRRAIPVGELSQLGFYAKIARNFG
jgi:hypothetical protein